MHGAAYTARPRRREHSRKPEEVRERIEAYAARQFRRVAAAQVFAARNVTIDLGRYFRMQSPTTPLAVLHLAPAGP
jgi:hypothetical protein